MNLDLRKKHALVGGSSAGLGLASAVELALLGADITLMARNESRLRQAITQLDISSGQKHDWLAADFNNNGDVKQAIEGLLKRRGPVHILVNNTGGPKPGLAIEASPDEYLQAFCQHLLNFQEITQAVSRGMKEANYGRIINIISTSVKEPIPGLGVSNTIRAAVAAWGKTLSRELGPFGITVNNLLPGYTRTARYESLIIGIMKNTGRSAAEAEHEIVRNIPLGRIGEPGDFGAVVAFLCSPAAAYVNGVSLPVDGGRLHST